MKGFACKNWFNLVILLISSLIMSISVFTSQEFWRYQESTLNVNAKVDQGEFIQFQYFSKDKQVGQTQAPAQYSEGKSETKIIIERLNEKNEVSKGNEVWIFNIRIGGKDLNWNDVKTQGQWETRNDSRGYDGKVFLSYQGSNNSISLMNVPVSSKIEIGFLKHDYSGEVKVTIGDRTEIIDLYAQNQTVFNYAVRVGVPANLKYSATVPAKRVDEIRVIDDRGSDVKVTDAALTNGNAVYQLGVNDKHYVSLDSKLLERKVSFIVLQIFIRWIFTTILFVSLWFWISKVTRSDFQNIEVNKRISKYFLFFALLAISWFLPKSIFSSVYFIILFAFFGLVLIREKLLSNLWNNFEYGKVFTLILVLGLLVRIFFILDYPYGFFFNDSSGYLQTSNALLKNLAFETNLDRTPGYGLFVYIIGIVFPYSSIYLIAFQHILGVLIAVIVYQILSQHINKTFSLVGMVLMIFSPHLLVYEHTILTDVLFTFVLIIFIFQLSSSIKKSAPLTNKEMIRWGFYIACLVMIRPAGYYLIPITVIVIFILNKQFGKSLVNIGKQVLLYIVPIAVVLFMWNSWNLYKHDYFGTTAINGLGLVLTAGNLIDYNSNNFQQEKSYMRNAVEKVNREYTGDLINHSKFLGWDPDGVRMSLINRLPNLQQSQIDQILYQICKEGILAHPLTYSYHVLNEFKKIYMHDMSFKYYSDLRGYLNFDSQSKTISLMSPKTTYLNAYTYSVPDFIMKKSTFDKFPQFNIINKLLLILPGTFNMKFYTTLFAGAILFSILSTKNKQTFLVVLLIAFINISHTTFNSITNYAVDRYMLPVLPCMIVVGAIGLSNFFHSAKKMNSNQFNIIKFGLFTSILLGAAYLYKKLFSGIKFGFYPDKPILGLSTDWYNYHQDYAVYYLTGLILLTFVGITVFFAMYKMHISKKYP